MSENHQNKTNNNQTATEDLRWVFNKKSKLWVPQRKKSTGFEAKTLWDKLNLLGTLAIPLIIALATIGLGLLQLHLADVAHQQDQHLADMQHQQDQQQALDQQQATILQTYIDNIQDLLLNHNLLKSSSSNLSNPYHDVAIFAQARTLTALQRLDPERKGLLLTFLYEANLIGSIYPPDVGPPPLGLDGADLSGAFLRLTELQDATIQNADLSGANLFGADLSGADLSGANFSGADLRSVDFNGANLSGANLSGIEVSGDLSFANLSFANLSEAFDLDQQQLDQVYSCKGAILPQGLICHHNL